jgi:peptidoglycan/LPS O-acetylase OafA/YrhL
MSEVAQTETSRECALDIFRIFAIMIILLFHYTFRGYAQGDLSILAFPNLGAIFKYGFFGVDLFLIISGYTILSSSTNKNLQEFIISRISRLYPAFWIAVTLTSLITLMIGGERFHVSLSQYLLNLTMIPYLIGVEEVDGVYWFLVVMLKFYLLVAVVIGLKLIKYQEYLAGLWLLFVFAFTSLFDLELSRYSLISEHASFFVAGIIFLSIKRKGWNLYRLFILLFSLWFSIYRSNELLLFFDEFYKTPFSPFIVSSLIALYYLAFSLVTTIKRSIKLSNKLILYGAATYPLFLIHHNIGFMIFNSLGKSYNKYLLLSATSVLMILVAIIIAKYVEPYIYRKLRTALESFMSLIKNMFHKA